VFSDKIEAENLSVVFKNTILLIEKKVLLSIDFRGIMNVYTFSVAHYIINENVKKTMWFHIVFKSTITITLLRHGHLKNYSTLQKIIKK
jgi:hypothetical protein